ncbi:unnamed protein product [Rotaria sordida]|uniref:Translin-associated factor X-interacting protein 1 N-terminal domain-containing protein n=1 Tax=Rotaria sordida TaxID=392033 RepID=A0A820B0S5_9BILA|nr:unnamed protein product [Rotaria sordida]CAF1033636.1 unnamed protein product [Rotaria sordida]CAF1037197.1 unnamed protein product [Rotaria sordida]CAF1076951.1 unnamed protein product [Rotaria sordida]CAF1110442.1 unnamed protein product [Rotaria sordida]
MNRKTKLTLGRQDDEIFIPSTNPSTQDDIRQLEERFHVQLYKELALENGLCPKRRQIYDDLFDELIRITKIHGFERGYLLERIKNEYQQWMNTYEELYSSSMAYSIRQYLYKMEEKKNLELTIDNLENDCKQLRDELEKESIKFQNLTEQLDENNQKQDKELRILRNNVQFLQSTNIKIKNDLENTLNQILSSTIFLGEPINYDEKKKTT